VEVLDSGSYRLRRVMLRFPAREFRLLDDVFKSRPLTLLPALFTLGVNEKQTISHAMSPLGVGDEGLEHSINEAGGQRMAQYYRQICHDSAHQEEETSETGRLRAQYFDELDNLVKKKGYKVISLLTCAGLCSQLVGGAHWISCKSSKDRTSMLCTLEAAAAVRRHSTDLKTPLPGGTLESDAATLTIAGELRQNGVRLRNCEINIGKAAYAFNALQIETLPEAMRPPPGTYGGSVKS